MYLIFFKKKSIYILLIFFLRFFPSILSTCLAPTPDRRLNLHLQLRATQNKKCMKSSPNYSRSPNIPHHQKKALCEAWIRPVKMSPLFVRRLKQCGQKFIPQKFPNKFKNKREIIPQKNIINIFLPFLSSKVQKRFW